MRIELANDNWVEVRDRILGSDRTAVQSVLKIRIKTSQEQSDAQETGADLMDRMHNALLNRVITAWSFPEPIPSAMAGASVEDLEIEYYSELHHKTADLMKKVNFKVPN